MPDTPHFRVLDPVHGLIEFSDQMVTRLIDSAPFQRLRGIRQLGLTSLVYPGATHDRFSHSIGVARITDQVLRQFDGINPGDAQTILVAALLHDLGHGPFSHVFERVKEAKKHASLSEMMLQHNEIKTIISDGGVNPVPLAAIWSGEGSHGSIISGALDCDRLDYLQRDQLMTGCFQGRFDWPWLMLHMRWQDDRGLMLSERAVEAAEEYLLARAHLYTTVYHHRTVRGAERMLVDLLNRLKSRILDDEIPLPKDHALAEWFQNTKPDSTLFLKLDDAHLLTTLRMLENSSDESLSSDARRILQRHLWSCFDVPRHQVDRALGVIEEHGGKHAVEDETGIRIDHIPFYAYNQKEPILIEREGEAIDLADLSPIAKALTQKRDLLRLYYDEETQRQEALKLLSIKN